LNIALCGKQNDRGMATKKIERDIDRDQLNGDPFWFNTKAATPIESLYYIYVLRKNPNTSIL